ncbi:putative zinc finger, A20 domain containing 1, partial [Operophtera brumata]
SSVRASQLGLLRKIFCVRASQLGLLRKILSVRASQLGLLRKIFSVRASQLGLLRKIFSVRASQLGLLRKIFSVRASQLGLLRKIFSVRASQLGLLRKIFCVRASQLGLLRKILSVRASQLGLLRKIFSVRASQLGLLRKIFSVRASQLGLLRKIFSVRASQLGLQRKIFSVRATQLGLLRKIFSVRASQLGLLRKIFNDLLETATLVTLESASILNWWRHGRVPGAPRLLPLATSGDGNCLPHAASLAALLLRSAGLSPTESEWEGEWRDTIHAASAEPHRHTPPAAPHYAGLEQLHVFALAHVMRRPVIVFADVALRPVAPIPFGGVYLPLELPPALCSRAPILLAYDAGHFSALAPCEPLPTDGARVPLEDQAGSPMPIRFNVDPGEEFLWEAEPDQRTINNLLPDDYQRSSMLALYLDLERVECLSTGQPPEELRRSLDALSTKSSKQMNSVAKQFGSIGRSMSSKIKKNFGSMAKLTGKSGSQSNPEDGLVRRQSTCEVLCCRVLAARAPPRYGTGRSQFYAEADRAAHEVARQHSGKSARPANDRTLYLCKSTFYDDRPPSPKPCKAPLSWLAKY